MDDYPKTIKAAGTPYLVYLRRGVELTQHEAAEVADLIHAGGAIKGTIEQIKDRVRTAHLFIIAKWGSKIIGVAALKAPQQSYRNRLQQETGVDLSANSYPSELGYVTVAKACQGQRLSSYLMEELMSLPIVSDGVFATTKLEDFYKNALPALGFEYRESYRNDDDEIVYILTKAALTHNPN